MAVGIYPRVSTAGQLDNTSLEEQIRLCREKAGALGFFDSNIKIYAEGQSGEDIDTRIELTKLREDVANGIVSAVICTHPDRFSRDLTDKLIVCREFEKNGAKLYFTDTEFPDSPEGALFFNIMSAIANYELQLIRKRTIRGRLAKVRNEKKIMPMRVAPFGYDKDKEGRLVIHDVERQYVQMIYEWYVFEKLTLREIGSRLYGKVKPKRAESPNWSASSISKILTSEIYIGKYYYNRRATKKVRGKLTKGGNPKKTYTLRDKEEWLAVEVPPIVDHELWERAQVQRALNHRHKHVGNAKHEYLLKSILKCGHCNRTYEATTTRGAKDPATGEAGKSRRYRCPNRAPKKYGPGMKACKVPSLNAEFIEGYIWDLAVTMTMKPDKFAEAMKRSRDDAISGVRDTLALLGREWKKKQIALEHIERDYYEAESEAARQRIAKHRNKYREEMYRLEGEIAAYEAKMDAHRMKEMPFEQIAFMVRRQRDRILREGEVPFELKRHMIEMLFDEIVITMEDTTEDTAEDTADDSADRGGGETSGEFRLNVASAGLYDKLCSDERRAGVILQPQEVRQYRGGSGGSHFDRNDRPH